MERPGPTVRVEVHEHTGAGVRRHEDRVAAEEPLELRLGWPGTPPHRVWVTMRTPGHDFELAAGWLVHEGVARASAIRSVAYCTDVDLTPQQELNVVTLSLEEAPTTAPGGRSHSHGSGSSACGVCGKDSIEAVLTTPGRGRGPGTRSTRRWCGHCPIGCVNNSRSSGPREESTRPRSPMRPVDCSSYARTSGGTMPSTR